MSRFERQMVTRNVLDKLNSLIETAGTVQKRLRRKERGKQRTLAGRATRAPQYQLSITWSLDGEGFTPSPELKSNRIYMMRLEIQQSIEPPLQGFKLEWLRPTSWRWTDRLGAVTYEEVVSNPLVVIRTVRSPYDVVGPLFRVIVREEFPLW